MSVSRETIDRLKEFSNLVCRWNEHINLVAPSTLGLLEQRHVEDSAQLSELAPPAHTWIDLGSGGGFPGIVISILRPTTRVLLVESDRRKSVFLRTAVRNLQLNAEVIDQRIENVSPRGGDIVSARALAPLRKLIPLAIRHGVSDTTYVFPKGISYQQEIAEAKTSWEFDVDVRPSKVNKEGVILLMRNFKRV
ncbi:16S rRNA (guanine(527)-N(7))-methyltransferase RsmG [Palleronia abyssalis]|uniref:Ribosomal RNA small subunit methyltransferase G n=1 Tax=Palleronia abyssalis TaxID=1501240 RepID=A0A2R8BSQ3_9RHOB|nr:16S rRNA (guanine(527)-N(7))-methyltransferase RsmG [Palleronia abyssalis]SPJ23173.1 Ribosomal RNA small subunit methyltransferase G [Palleronia abyssalis]